MNLGRNITGLLRVAYPVLVLFAALMVGANFVHGLNGHQIPFPSFESHLDLETVDLETADLSCQKKDFLKLTRIHSCPDYEAL